MACTHFGVCGGCSLQHLSYAAQLRQKTDRVRQLILSGTSNANRNQNPGARSESRAADARLPTIGPMLGMPVDDDGMPWRFRQKVAFVFGAPAQGKGLVMGHYARGSKHIVPVEECPVHSARGNRIAFALRDRLARAGITAAGTSRTGILRHLIVRTTEDDREAVAMLVVTRNDKSLRTPVKGLLESVDRPDGFLVNIHDRPGPFMVGPETMKIAGRSHVREKSIGPAFLVSPTAFFQTNVVAAAHLVRMVVEGIGPATRVLDLFSGSGLFTLPLAARGMRVVAVEENRQAVNDAEANVRLNRVPADRVRLVTSSVEDALPRLARDRFDAVILDPPRSGCSPAVLSGVFERIAPARAVYVSCDPEALARELPVILQAGYGIVNVQPVDMFPHTEHIETVVQLVRLDLAARP